MDIRRKAVRDVLLRVNEVILGKERLTLEVLAALLAGGHVLLEDMPGAGSPFRCACPRITRAGLCRSPARSRLRTGRFSP